MTKVAQDFLALCWLVALAGSIEASRAEPEILGLWLVEDGDAQVEIAPCGEKLCGRVVWLGQPYDESGAERRDHENPDPDLRDRKILGLELLRDVPPRPDDSGVYRRGAIYDPKSGKTYVCQLSLGADGTLKLRGYIGFSLFGRTTQWTRPAGETPAK